MHAYGRRRQYIQMRHNMSLQIMTTDYENGAIRLYSIGLDLIDKRAFIDANTGKFSIYCVYLNRVIKTKLHNLSRI